MAVSDLEDSAEQIRQCLIGTKNSEIALIQLDDVLKELAEHKSILSLHGSGRRHVNRVNAEIRHSQVVQQNPAIGVWVGAHSPVTLGRKLRQFSYQPPGRVKQLLRLVAFHPAFELRDMLRMSLIDKERHLVRPEGSLDLQPVDDFRPGPALGRSQDDHWPARPGGILGGPRSGL